MRLLLDTHYLVWMAVRQHKLDRTDHEILADDDIALSLSVVSLWELRLKWPLFDRHGRRKAALAPDAGLAFCRARGIEIVSLEAQVCIAPGLDPPLTHHDPFDELLLVHAQVLGARLLTRDRQLAGHPLVYSR